MRGLPHKFRCGDFVYEVIDVTHVGRIVQIDSGIWATIKWDSGWYSERVKLTHLCKTSG